jgi:hypothetical protein
LSEFLIAFHTGTRLGLLSLRPYDEDLFGSFTCRPVRCLRSKRPLKKPGIRVTFSARAGIKSETFPALGVNTVQKVATAPKSVAQETNMKKWRSIVFAALLTAVAIPALAGSANAATSHHGHHHHHGRRK